MQYSNILARKLQVIFHLFFVKHFVDNNENTAQTCATFNYVKQDLAVLLLKFNLK